MTKPYEQIIEQHGTGTKFIVRTFEDSVDEDELVCDQPISELKAEQTLSRGHQVAQSQQQEQRNGDVKEKRLMRK